MTSAAKHHSRSRHKAYTNLSLALFLALIGEMPENLHAVQTWSEQPVYQEVNPGGQVIMPCIVINKRGECRWERDGQPVGIHPGKYEWAGPNKGPSADPGDCSLKVLDASLDFDDGVWQCQITPSSFKTRDALISQGAQLVVREKPDNIVIQRVGDTSSLRGHHEVVASAGEDLELECITTGGNPPAKMKWYMGDQEIHTGHTQEDSRPSLLNEENNIISQSKARTWTSISRLMLPVSKSDNGATVRCVAQHPALEKPLEQKTFLTIHYPPSVTVETTPLDYLEEEKDSVSLRCKAESNPQSKVVWYKENENGIFSVEKEIHISPVTRHSAGTYKCVAENTLGLSEPAFVDLDVKYSPSILSVGPSKVVSAHTYNRTLLTCNAQGNPPPKYQWLQKFPTHDIMIRGYAQQLFIENVTYEHQGEYVCKAINEINGETRSVQSDPITLEVNGAPQVMRFGVQTEIIIDDGQDAILESRFCANPLPEQLWHLGSSGDNIILAAGTTHGKFVAEIVRKIPYKDDCYVSRLTINGASPSDSYVYELRLTNAHGTDSYKIDLKVREHLSPELLVAIAVVVGCILTILILTLIILYAVRAEKCCCGNVDNNKKRHLDIESDKTDVESTHSSNISGYRHGNNGYMEKTQAVIPPDALYATTTKKLQNRNSFYAPPPINSMHPQQQSPSSYAFNDPSFNDSKEGLRPDMVPHSNPSFQQNNQQQAFSTGNSNRGYISAPSPSNLLVNQSQTSNSSCDSQNNRKNHHVKFSGNSNGGIRNTSYNELCFPKTSNYGSMRKKKKMRQDSHLQTNNVGVDCRLNYAVPTSINTHQIEEGIYSYDQSNAMFHSNL